MVINSSVEILSTEDTSVASDFAVGSELGVATASEAEASGREEQMENDSSQGSLLSAIIISE